MTMTMTTTFAFDPRRLLPIGRHGWLIRTPGFTAAEVRQLLRTPPTDPRGLAVARCVARVGAWLPPEPHFIDCPYHTWQHLARIVFWYSRGDDIETIGRRIGSLGAPWSIDRTLNAACARMASCLNQDSAAYGLPPFARPAGRSRSADRR